MMFLIHSSYKIIIIWFKFSLLPSLNFSEISRLLLSSLFFCSGNTRTKTNKKMAKEVRVGIIGGGVAGLSAAYHLLHQEERKKEEKERKKGEEEVVIKVVVLEARDRLGGRAYSKEDGIDRGKKKRIEKKRIEKRK